MTLFGKTVLVVGASGVLGGEFVRALAGRGAKVLAVSSTQESAARIPAEARLRLFADLTQPQSIDVLATYLLANWQLDGVILAAGRVGFGGSQQTSVPQAAALMQVNHLGPAQLVSKLIPNLVAGQEPYISGITGVVAEKAFAGMNAYSASKAAMSSWLDSLRIELKSSGVQVLEARPGHTETGLASRPLFGMAPKMPAGMEPQHVVEVILGGLIGGASLLTSKDF